MEALSNKDWEACAENFDPNVIYVPTKEWPESRPRRGRDELEEFMRGRWDDWEKWEVEVKDSRSSGDRVLIETRINTVAGKTGIEMRGRTFHVFTLRDGLITHLEDFIDPAEAE